MKLNNQALSNEDLFLTDSEVNMLGPQLSLNNCNIVSEASAKALSISDVSIVGGTFHTKVTLSDFQWCKASLNGVKLLGSYSGCDFGRWEEFHGAAGNVENCDFSEANLDNCRFMNCDVSNIKYPKWPCFTIFDPRNKADAIKNINWPGKWKLIMGIFANSPEGCSAVCGNAQILLKRLGGSEEEIKSAFSNIGNVFL